MLESRAHQWMNYVTEVLRPQPSLPAERRTQIRYEEFTADPPNNFQAIADFLEVEFPGRFMGQIPTINGNNTGKWRTNLPPEELRRIGPIIGDSLITLGYKPGHRWHGDQ